MEFAGLVMLVVILTGGAYAAIQSIDRAGRNEGSPHGEVLKDGDPGTTAHGDRP